MIAASAQSFSFPRLRLDAPNGLTNRLFTAGNRVVPDATIPAGAWYRVKVFDPAGALRSAPFPCTDAASFGSTDNGYLVQASDPPTTNGGTYKFVIEQFADGACGGAPVNVATQQFFVVTATAYTSAALATATNRFNTSQTAYLRVLGLPLGTINWNVTWLLPNGSTSCVNSAGSDRPDTTGTGQLTNYLQYPPFSSGADDWNLSSAYTNAGPCAGFSLSNQGVWQLKLTLGVISNWLSLPVFLLSNDCVGVSISPSATNRCAGDPITFTALTNGTGPFTFVWRKDGVVVTGASSSSLTIPSATTSTAGVYTVEVTAACGSATNSALLSVSSPQIPQALPDQSNCSGDTVVFSAPTNGSGPFTFQWRRGTTNITGATNQFLVLTNVALSSTGTYRVVVGNFCNSVTNSGNLFLRPGVSLSPLTNSVRYVAGAASFSTVATGTGPISYQWWKEGEPLPGQTNASLMLSNLLTSDTGTYSVTATTTNGCSAQRSATLLVAYCFNSLDVMLVIDRSGSMSGQPFADARIASTNFMRHLILGTNSDFAGLASYNPTSTLNHVLSTNLTSIEQAIAALPAPTNGTCITCGLTNAQAELASIRHRSGALPVMVLLSDGRPHDFDTPAQALASAAAAKAAGTRLFTVGLNDGSSTNVDIPLMQAMASSTNDFFYAENSSQLSDVFDQISAILCRGPNRIEGPAPSNAVVCAGATVQFDVSATNCAIFTFQWSHNGVLLPDATNASLLLPAVTEAEAGVYSVVISSFCGTITNSATLVVYPAFLAIGPLPQTRCAGQQVDFTVQAFGTNLTYQWYHELALLPGQTNATLTISNVTPADAGSYMVFVDGECTSGVFTSTALTVNSPPALSGLSNVVACPGQNISLQPVTTGTGPFTYLWRRDGEVLPGATNSLLNLGPANGAAAGAYTVEIAGLCGVATGTVTVVVLSNTVATPLSGQTVCVGESASFTTAPGGSGPFTFVWRHNSVPIPGATNAALFLASVTTNDGGFYSVEVIGACGSASQAAVLVVRPLTTATPLPNVSACEGGSISLVTTVQGSGPFHYLWRHDGTLLPDATNASLTLSNLTLADAGAYAVEVMGVCSSVTNVAVVTVRQVTSATAVSDQVRCEGEAATFSTSPSGTGPFTFQWLHEGQVLAGETNATLALAAVATNLAGTYSVEVAGACNRLTNQATLTVLLSTLATPLADRTVCAGEMAMFATTVTGQGPHAFMWTHNGSAIEGATNSVLTLSNATEAMAGTYVVLVAGTCNSVTNGAQLSVRSLTVATPLAEVTRCAGEGVAFSTVPSGTGPFVFVWRRDGLVLEGETNATLSFVAITTNNAGLYTVEVFGACNAVTNSAALSVRELTSSSPLADAVVCEGATATFTTTPSGTGPFNYLWRRDGMLLVEATSGTLLISNASVADVGSYAVEVTGACNAVTNAATLGVRLRTTMTPPADVTACAGDDVTFQGVAAGTGPFTYQWRRNGELLAGETNALLSLALVGTNAAGIYALEVYGACNAVTNVAALTVRELTTATPLGDATVCVGDALTLSTTVAGTGPFTFVWRHAGDLLAGQTNASLSLTNITAVEAGLYSVEVSGACNAVTNSAVLQVRELTSAMPFAGATRCVGDAHVFQTEAAGTGPFRYVWRRDGVLLPDATNASLSLPSVGTNDAGLHTVEVVGACNAVTNAALLIVQELTTATALPPVLACEDSPASFTTAAQGTGPFQFVWRRDGVELPGETNATLHLPSVSTNDAGLYSVEVSGACNTVTNSALLTVLRLTVVEPLVGVTNCPGAAVVFSAVVSGEGPFQFTWRHQGQIIADATNAVLQLPSIGPADAGTYTVEVQGACNAITNSAALTVLTPTTAQFPANIDSCVGQTLFLFASPQGTGPFTFVWRKDGQVIWSYAGFIIASAAGSDSGVYTVEITGACNSITNQTTITVRELVDAAPLADAVRCAGDSFTFTAAVTGSEPITYVWRKDGVILDGVTNSFLTLTNLGTNDAGQYSFEASGLCNVVTRQATLAVNASVTATPLADAASCVGDTVSLSSTIAGAGPLTVVWRKDGVELVGETNATLVRALTSTNDAGLYTIEVGGLCGSVTNSALLSVAEPFALETLGAITRCAGSDVTMTAGSGGGDAVTFLWLRDGVILAGATNRTLVLTNLAAGDGAAYRVEVVTPCGALTNHAALTVLAPPTALVNQARCIGGTAVFSTMTSGGEAVTFVWRKDGVLLGGQTNSTLVLTALTTNASGTYAVEVSGPCGSFTNSATLAVLQPTMITAMGNQVRCAGANVTFLTFASGGGPFSYVWRKNGEVIPGRTNFSLPLSGVTAADTATYTVEVTGACDAATNSATLTVNTVPVITALNPLSACVGQPAVFAPVISGSGNYTRQWRRNGVPLPGATNASLAFAAVGQADAGTYTLEVYGPCGNATNSATLTLRTNAVIAGVVDQLVCPGQLAVIPAEVGGTGPFSFLWKKDGFVLSNAVGSTLWLTNVTAADAGLYTLEVTASCNTTSASAVITVGSVTTATPLADATNCAGSTAVLSTVPAGTGPFSFQWRKNGVPLPKQTNATLVLTNLVLTNAGLYAVEVAGCTTVTNQAELAVIPLLEATMPPVTTACTCDDVILQPTVATPGTFSFAWRRNGVLIPGGTNAGLPLEMLNMHSPAVYSVEIGGPCNSLTLTTRLEVINVTSGRWTNNDGTITIPEFGTASPYPSTNLVMCAPKIISQLRVTLVGVTHDFPDDVDLALMAPNGQAIRLMSDAGGGGANALVGATFVFADDAAGFLRDNGFNLPGTYKPTDVNEGETLVDIFLPPGPTTNFAYATQLSAFYGSNPNGVWKLFAVDDHGQQQGSIQKWILDFGRAEFVFTNVWLSDPVMLAGGAYEMELHGESNKIYFLEASTNLVDWTIIQTNQLPAASMRLIDNTAPVLQHRFYRVSGCREYPTP